MEINEVGRGEGGRNKYRDGMEIGRGIELFNEIYSIGEIFTGQIRTFKRFAAIIRIPSRPPKSYRFIKFPGAHLVN